MSRWLNPIGQRRIPLAGIGTRLISHHSLMKDRADESCSAGAGQGMAGSGVGEGERDELDMVNLKRGV